MEYIIAFIVLVLSAGVVLNVTAAKKRGRMSPKERLEQAYQDKLKWGALNPVYVCPHCQTKGAVYTKFVERKKGISGAKTTGALLTGGLSILVTGLSKKDNLTQAHCGNCNCTWDF